MVIGRATATQAARARRLSRTTSRHPWHHGSRYSSPAFLSAVAPRVVLVSVGAGNTYGQPNLALLASLERGGAVVRRTDTSGDVAVTGTRPMAGGGPKLQ